MNGEKVLALIRQHSPTRRVERSEWTSPIFREDLSFSTSCFACGHAITNVVVITPKARPRSELLLGTDCYEFLLAQWSGTELPPSKSDGYRRFRSDLRALYRSFPAVTKATGAGSWPNWLKHEVESRAGAVHEDVRRGVVELKQNDFIATERFLNACVKFHNATRKFPAEVLFGRENWRGLVSSRASLITIDEASELKRRRQLAPRVSAAPAALPALPANTTPSPRPNSTPSVARKKKTTTPAPLPVAQRCRHCNEFESDSLERLARHQRKCPKRPPLTVVRI